jgi:Cu/Ag efflux protein CusF
MNADQKLFAELSKVELAISFVQNNEKIENLKLELKKLELENENIENLLLPQIGLKYQPKNENFILMPKITNGRKSTSYATVVNELPKVCNLNKIQLAKFTDLLTKQTKIGENKKTIQIIK